MYYPAQKSYFNLDQLVPEISAFKRINSSTLYISVDLDVEYKFKCTLHPDSKQQFVDYTNSAGIVTATRCTAANCLAIAPTVQSCILWVYKHVPQAFFSFHFKEPYLTLFVIKQFFFKVKLKIKLKLIKFIFVSKNTYQETKKKKWLTPFLCSQVYIYHECKYRIVTEYNACILYRTWQKHSIRVTPFILSISKRYTSIKDHCGGSNVSLMP